MIVPHPISWTVFLIIIMQQPLTSLPRGLETEPLHEPVVVEPLADEVGPIVKTIFCRQ
jgi:hypothetical protein